jgi:hypothetical protein
MKKLLVFLTVLAVAGVANGAVIDILVNGADWIGQDVEPSDRIKVTWRNDVAGVYGGGFGAFQISVSNGDYYEGTGWVNTTALPVLPGITVTATDPGHNVYLTGGTYMEVPTGDMASWEFHVPDYKVESDYIIIDPYAGSWNSVYAYPGEGADQFPYIVLHVIPEPMTIALLGMGGLFLLRRRRR